MASPSTRELRQLSGDALKQRARELRTEIIRLAFHAQQRKEKNVKKRRMLRHELARVLTLLTERETTRASR